MQVDFVPEMLGIGNHRVVWSHENPGLVVKTPRKNNRFGSNEGIIKNLEEWYAWEMAGARLRKWLCRPHEVLCSGVIIIMERGDPIDYEPEDAPGILAKNNNQYPNWVMVNGEPKRCDYHLIYEELKKQKK